MIAGQQSEWLDLKALRQYACVSDRTLREWIHRTSKPLPAVRVGTKMLVRKSTFDQWLESHRLAKVDVSGIVDEMISGLMGAN